MTGGMEPVDLVVGLLTTGLLFAFLAFISALVTADSPSLRRSWWRWTPGAMLTLSALLFLAGIWTAVVTGVIWS